jgi:predicted lactoylglutathione lyase
MSRMAFVNLPVKDLAATTEFFTKLGFSFDAQFANEESTCMVISDSTVAMLHLEPVFDGFTGQQTGNGGTTREVIVGLSATSPDEVDDLVDIAVSAGGQPLGDAVAQGPMYMRAFRDLDGHQWSFIHMDMSSLG